MECIFTWGWLADLCVREGIKFVLGHALYMKAIHGGKAKNDKIDAYKIATLLRGGTLAQAYVYPPEMRGTRDLLRRRNHLVNKRAELLAHIHNTSSQYNLPAFTKKIAHKSAREGLAERFTEDAVRRSVELNLALINTHDRELDALERHIVKDRERTDPRALAVLRSVPGIGRILALIILYENTHRSNAFPKSVTSCPMRAWSNARESQPGRSTAPRATKSGNAHLRWAFGQAACLFLRNNPDGHAFINAWSASLAKRKPCRSSRRSWVVPSTSCSSATTVFDRQRFLQR